MAIDFGDRPLQVPSVHPVINATLPSQTMMLKSNGLMAPGLRNQAVRPKATTASLPGTEM
jgi:hypothetical protein